MAYVFVILFLSDKLINLAMRLKYSHLSSYHATPLCLFIDINIENKQHTFTDLDCLNVKLRQETNILADNGFALERLLCSFVTPK